MRRSGRLGRVVAATTVLVGLTIALTAETSSARAGARVTMAQCKARPWVSAGYQAKSTPGQLADMVLQCLKLEFPTTYQHDEVGIVALNESLWFQNVNEFGLTSTVQREIAKLGMPPITLEDGPGGLVTPTFPAPTQLPNELALAATFDPAVASQYGAVLGLQAHVMGYDAVQAPDLNLLRVPAWGRAAESFGESPVLAGEMGAALGDAIMARHVIPVFKHFGPYSQETDRRGLNQSVAERTYQEVYIRPFTLALRSLIPYLLVGHHAVGIMCSYGNVNATRACQEPELANELACVGVHALVRSDLQVEVDPAQLLLNGVDLIKPMNTAELVAALRSPAVDAALDTAVQQVWAIEFADGLVNGSVTAAVRHRLPLATALAGHAEALAIEERAAVLLKDVGALPLRRGSGRVAVIGDVYTRKSCPDLATALGAVVGAATCTDTSRHLPTYPMFAGLPYSKSSASATATFVAPATAPYVLSAGTWGSIQLAMDGAPVIVVRGNAEFSFPRTALVRLQKGTTYTFHLTYTGTPPKVELLDAQPAVDAAVKGVAGAREAVVIAYDFSHEGMDRYSLSLPDAQDAIISAIAARVPTVVLLASDGAVAMPWLGQVRAVLEVWNPTSFSLTDRSLDGFVPAYTRLLDGAVDPSGRLPVTFPVSTQRSPMGVPGFWPGTGGTVNLDLPPDSGLGIGMAWYRAAGWPVLYPFGYGLSYTRFALAGGAVTSGSGVLRVHVAVRDTGHVAGAEPVEVYADWPSTLGEPHLQLVGFAVASFTAAQAEKGAVAHVVLTISPDSLSVYQGAGWKMMKGAYCIEAATYDGDPHGYSTGPITLAPATRGGIIGPASTALVAGDCAS